MFLAPTRDQGVSAGFTHASFGNVRLTIFFNPRDQRIHTHISDPAVKRFPWSQQIDPAFLEDSLRRLTKSWDVTVREVPYVFVMRPRLIRKVAKLLPKAIDPRTAEFPLEASDVRIRLDLRNPLRWRKVRSRDLSATPPFKGYAMVKGVPREVHPLPGREGHLLCFSERQGKRANAKLERLIGAEMFGEYLETRKVGEEFLRAARAKQRQRG